MNALSTYTPPDSPSTLLERERECLDVLRERFQQAVEAETEYRTEAVAALTFRNGDQWDPTTRKQREASKRPVLTINTSAQYERQILNEQRMNRPSIKVRPVGSGADVDTAKVLQGVIRHIEQRSHADQAYDTAQEAAVRHGRGYFRLLIDYMDPMSFQQELVIRRIRNPFMVYMDPHCQLPTYADAQWAIVFEHVPKKVHQTEWGIDTATMESWMSQGDTWLSRDEVRVAEYFFKDPTRYTLAKLADNTTLLLEPLVFNYVLEATRSQAEPEAVHAAVQRLFTWPRGMAPLRGFRSNVANASALLEPLGPEFTGWFVPQMTALADNIADLRQTRLDRIWHCKTNGHVILEEDIWPGRWIPIIPVLGNELDINGRVRLSGYLKDAMDPMRAKNYWVTMQAEHIALAPVPPWLVAAGQVDKYTDLWATANREPHAYLPYDPVDVRGTPVPPPIRAAFEPPIQAITLAMQGSERDTEAAIGIYRANLAAPTQEKSGVALRIRDEQADTGTYHYGDNLRRAIEFLGEQCVDLIPKIPSYTHAEVLRIIGDDGSPKMVRTMPDVTSHAVPPGDESGIAGIYDLSTGQYDVIVDVGPSYQSKREEALEALTQVGQMSPKIAELGADLIVGNIDAHGMEELAQRLKKTLPPELLEDSAQGDPKEQVIQLQAAMQQLTQQVEQLNAYAQEAETNLQRLAQENEALKADHALKQQELALEREKFNLEATVELERLGLERRKMALEERKVSQAAAQESEDEGSD